MTSRASSTASATLLTNCARVSAKCIATCLHMMQGTPYIYQGEELGMVNYPFRSVKDFNDLESINAYYELTEKMGWKPSEIFPKIAFKSRDNARTPMQGGRLSERRLYDRKTLARREPELCKDQRGGAGHPRRVCLQLLQETDRTAPHIRHHRLRSLRAAAR